MNAPDKCPKCKAERIKPYKRLYQCGSEWMKNNDSVWHPHNADCVLRITTAERDQLAARVKELEAERESMVKGLSDPNIVWVNMLRGTIAMPLHIKEADQSLNKLQAHVDTLDKAVEAWKTYAARLEVQGDALRKAIARFDGCGMDGSCLREWDQAEIEGLTVGDLWKAALAAVRWDQAKETKP